MSRQVILGLAAATLAATVLVPDAALAHYGGRVRFAWYSPPLYTSDPRAARAGYTGGHYGRECFRAASGRRICPDRY
jgi:hypothetical protein